MSDFTCQGGLDPAVGAFSTRGVPRDSVRTKHAARAHPLREQPGGSVAWQGSRSITCARERENERGRWQLQQLELTPRTDAKAEPRRVTHLCSRRSDAG